MVFLAEIGYEISKGRKMSQFGWSFSLIILVNHFGKNGDFLDLIKLILLNQNLSMQKQ